MSYLPNVHGAAAGVDPITIDTIGTLGHTPDAPEHARAAALIVPNGTDRLLQALGDIRLDASDKIPLHAQLASALRSRIRSEALPSGTTLPGEFQLAQQLHVSRHTVRHAIGVLVSEGWLRRQRGAKTVVGSGPPPEAVIERRLGTFYAFAWEIEARGGVHRSRLLERTNMRADARLAQSLQVEMGTPLQRIERLRQSGDEPLILEVVVLPARLAAAWNQSALERESIYDLLERQHGIVVERALETLRPVVLDRRAARLLRVADGSAAFEVERVSWSADGPIDWERSLIRGDRYLYSVESPRRTSQ
jgi:GntR family transcriptional regulator, N-acetylglucosamine utilization regulator